jgi:alginate production protein
MRVLAVLVLLLGLALPARAEEDEEEEADLRERLTEREDKRRPLDPRTIDVAGRPLVVGGEWEAGIVGARRFALGKSPREPDRVLFEQQLEIEGFYSFGPELSLFAQLQVIVEEDLLAHSIDEVSDQYVEIGELWVNSANVFGSDFSVDAGRIDFEDDRRWWWDDELDAVRVIWERETFEVQLAVGRDFAPSRSDHSYVEPENDRVVRWIGEASWDVGDAHGFELFFLHAEDHSRRERTGDVVHEDREDDSDARLTWLGARAMGAFDLGNDHLLGYWLDAATVHGRERIVDWEDVSPRHAAAGDVSRRDVAGWGVDLGVNWMLPGPLEPRLFAGYAFTSRDRTPESGDDRTFRQTDLQENEAGFGGVEHYPHYGLLLEPELSNLRVLTLGAGISVFESSSLDLVYHYDRLVAPAEELRDSLLEIELNGRDRDLGQELNLVLSLEEWERFELHLAAAAFRAGRAFGEDHGKWAYGGGVVLKYAF